MARNLSLARVAGMLALSSLASVGCERAPRAADAVIQEGSTGAQPSNITTVAVRTTRDLVENSAAAMSMRQPGVLYTINDSGNEPILFALDTTGADRGAWRVTGATDVDWEATAVGPCGDDPAPHCVYIGDVGDDLASHPDRAIYRVHEPDARDSAFTGVIEPERITYTYSDRRHDVEAMFVPNNGDIYLITKRPLRAFRTLRPALIFRIPASAWSQHAPVVAQLVDSLPIVPGSALLRTITDASLSPDRRHLAVRTYGEVYVFAVDAATGAIDHRIAAAVCNIVPLGEPQGEGITWASNAGRFVFSSEGHDAPLHLANCPLPR